MNRLITSTVIPKTRRTKRRASLSISKPAYNKSKTIHNKVSQWFNTEAVMMLRIKEEPKFPNLTQSITDSAK